MIAFVLFASLIMLVFSCYLAIKRYKKVDYFPPGVLFLTIVGLYGLLPILVYVIDHEALYDMSGYFSRYANDDIMLKILFMYTTVIFSAMLAEVFLLLIKTKPFANKKNIKNIRFKVYNLTLWILLVIIILIIYLKYKNVGGIIGFLSFNSRRDAFTEIGSHSVFFAQYQLFQYTFLLFILYKIRDEGLSFVNKSYIFIYIVFMGLHLVLGTRLEIVNNLILFFSFIFIYYKNLIVNNLKKIYISIFVIILAFSFYGVIRSQTSLYLAGLTNKIDADISLMSFFPKEFATGYVPALVIEHNQDYYHYSTFQFLKFFPNSLLSLFDENKAYLAKNLAEFDRASSGYTVYTVTLPIDTFYGLGQSFFFLFLYVFLFYIFIDYLFKWFKSLKTKGYGLMILFYVSIWPLVRWELANSFNKFMMILGIFIFFYYLNMFFTMISKGKYRQKGII